MKIKVPLYFKFILGYLAFGLLGFATISTFSSSIMYGHQLESYSETIYDEANLIASSYSSVYQGKNNGQTKKQNMDTAYLQLQAVADFAGAEIWIVNRQGIVVTDSSRSARAGTEIPGFDPTATGNRQYSVSDYYGLFPYDVMTVSAPITGNYNTYGYVLVHMPVSRIREASNKSLDVVYISAAFIFVLSLIILLVFRKTVSIPLKKITEGANEYAAGNLEYHIELNLSLIHI